MMTTLDRMSKGGSGDNGEKKIKCDTEKKKEKKRISSRLTQTHAQMIIIIINKFKRNTQKKNVNGFSRHCYRRCRHTLLLLLLVLLLYFDFSWNVSWRKPYYAHNTQYVIIKLRLSYPGPVQSVGLLCSCKCMWARRLQNIVTQLQSVKYSVCVFIGKSDKNKNAAWTVAAAAKKNKRISEWMSEWVKNT